MSKHRQRDVPIPGVPTANFVFVQSRFLFGLLEAFFDCPTATGDANQLLQSCARRSKSEVVSEISIILERPANEQALAHAVVGGKSKRSERPFVYSFSLGSGTTTELPPCGILKFRRAVYHDILYFSARVLVPWNRWLASRPTAAIPIVWFSSIRREFTLLGKSHDATASLAIQREIVNQHQRMLVADASHVWQVNARLAFMRN